MISADSTSASPRALRWFPWVAVGALLVVRLCHEWFGPDIWYHLALGERIARTGIAQPADNLLLHQPGFVNVYWLFQLLVRGAFALGGIVGVSAVFIVVWLAAFASWLRTTGATRSAWVSALGLGAVLVCQTRFEERPEIFSYLFLALQIHWLSNWKLDTPTPPRDLARFVLVQALWSNMHGYFALGPLLVGAKLLSVAVAPQRPRDALRGLAWLLALTIAATLVSPFGLNNWRGVAALWKFFGEMRHEVQEFLPPTGAYFSLWTVKLFWIGWAGTLLAGLYFLFTAARREAFALLLAAAGLWLSATAFRNIPLLVFLAAPLGAATLSRLPTFRSLEKLSAVMIGAAALALGGLAVTRSFGGATFGIRESRAALPVQFAEFLRGSNFRGALFDHPGDGGYLEFQFPSLRLYGDSRYVDAAPVREYFAALRSPDDFRALYAKHHFDAALFRVGYSRAVLRELLQGARWRLVYTDLHRALVVDVTSPVAAALSRESLKFYASEDLTEHANGDAALQWIALFAEANLPADVLRVLNAFAAAPRLPPVVLEAALRYALAARRREIFDAAKSLRGKMLATNPADAAVVDRLIAAGSSL